MKTLCQGGPLHNQEIEVSDKAATFTCSTEGRTFMYVKKASEIHLIDMFVCEDC